MEGPGWKSVIEFQIHSEIEKKEINELIVQEFVSNWILLLSKECRMQFSVLLDIIPFKSMKLCVSKKTDVSDCFTQVEWSQEINKQGKSANGFDDTVV